MLFHGTSVEKWEDIIRDEGLDPYAQKEWDISDNSVYVTSTISSAKYWAEDRFDNPIILSIDDGGVRHEDIENDPNSTFEPDLKLNSYVDPSYIEVEAVRCEKCNNWFDSLQGMRVHKSKTH